MPRPPNASRVKALQSTACSVAPAALVEEEVAQPTAPADLPASRSPLRVMNVDTHAASPKAIAELKAAGMLAESVKLGQVTYLNNLIEQDHRFLKRLVKPGMGFFSSENRYFETKNVPLQSEPSCELFRWMEALS